MERRQIGVVKALFRYPVKSMQGEKLSGVEVDESGVVGDRTFALREVGGRIVSAKNRPEMLKLYAAYGPPFDSGSLGSLRITLPDGRTVDAHADDAAAVISEQLGFSVVLEGASGNSDQAEFDLDGATIFGDVPVEQVLPDQTAKSMPESWTMPPGTFFDEFKITVLTTGTLSHLHTLVGEDAHLDPQRFRPNILVESEAGDEGFVEDGWLKGTLELGEHVRLSQVGGLFRCVMITHEQPELERDMRILRVAVHQHQNNVGVSAVIEVPGTVKVGDPVVLIR